MRKLICLSLILAARVSMAQPVASDVTDLAKANGFTASPRVVAAIVEASRQYRLDAKELTAIAILETGLGRYNKPRLNSNGTTDVGIFQINSINAKTCLEYRLDTPEGSALCAAKLIYKLKQRRNDYLGAYHSKTPSKKQIYVEKLTKVLVASGR